MEQQRGGPDVDSIAALGDSSWMVFASFSVNLIYQFWVHTERIDKLPRLFEFVFNTPSHHRVHHGMDPVYLDKNYGGILIIWDRLFATFQPELFRPHYGLTKRVGTFNIWNCRPASTSRSPATCAGPAAGATGWDTCSDHPAGNRSGRPERRSRPCRSMPKRCADAVIGPIAARFGGAGVPPGRTLPTWRPFSTDT